MAGTRPFRNEIIWAVRPSIAGVLRQRDRKLAQTLPEAETMEFIRWLEQFPIMPLDAALFHQAVLIRNRYQIAYWDAAIIAAAKALGATTLYSEDLSHGQVYDGVQVVNPFLDSPNDVDGVRP